MEIINSIPALLPLVLKNGVLHQAITEIYDDETQAIIYKPVTEQLSKDFQPSVVTITTDPASTDPVPVDTVPAPTPVDPVPAPTDVGTIADTAV